MTKNFFKATRSFQSRMIFSILIIAGVTGAFGLTIVYFVGKNILQENIGNEFLHSAQETSKNLSRLFKQQIDETYALGIAPKVIGHLRRSDAPFSGHPRAYQGPIEQGQIEWSDLVGRSRFSERLLTIQVSRHIQFFHRMLGRSDEDVGSF